MRVDRRARLAAAVLSTCGISAYQYAFGPVFSLPLQAAFQLTKPEAMQLFFCFSLFQTLPVPFWGWVSERFSARGTALLGGLLMGAGWIVCAYAKTRFGLMLGYGAISGTGAGMLYIVAVGCAVKWFPEKKGLAAGLVIFGFGAGSALSVIPLQWCVSHLGLPRTFLLGGLINGAVFIACSSLLAYPPRDLSSETVPSVRIPFAPFLLLTAAFTLFMSTSLFLTAHLGDITKWLGLSSVVMWGTTAAALAGALGGAAVGLGRIGWGRLSDRIGRLNSLVIAYVSCGAFFCALATPLARHPAAFVALIVLAFFCASPAANLLAALIGDVFGLETSSMNFGGVYVGKAASSLIASVGSTALFAASGSYKPVFLAYAALCFLLSALIYACVPQGRNR